MLLFARTEWRDSSDGAAITETVLAALHDESTLVRMIAAHAARALHADKTTVERVAAVGGILHGERIDRTDRPAGSLGADAASAPLEVEAVLERFAASFGDRLADAWLRQMRKRQRIRITTMSTATGSTARRFLSLFGRPCEARMDTTSPIQS